MDQLRLMRAASRESLVPLRKRCDVAYTRTFSAFTFFNERDGK